MSDNIDRNRRHRATILRLVRRYGADGITWESLRKVFMGAGLFVAADNLEENVTYLSNKGYLVTEWLKDPISGVQRWMIRITPQAIDLLDGTIDPDPGVDTIA